METTSRKANIGVSPIATGITEESPLVSGITRGTKSCRKRHKSGDSLKRWENLEPILRALIEKNKGGLPSQLWLVKNNCSDIVNAIFKHHGGFCAVRKKLGLKVEKKHGNLSLMRWANLEPVLREIIGKNDGKLPGSARLRKQGYSDVDGAITMHHGGFQAVRSKLGFEQLIKTGDDSLMHWKNIEPALRGIIRKNNGALPGQKKLTEQGYGDVISAISKYHGGFHAVREKLGLPIIRNKLKTGGDSLKHWRNIEPVLIEIIRKNNGALPGQKKLAEQGYGDVVAAIRQHHGSIIAVREKLRQMGMLNDRLSDTEAAEQLKSALSDYAQG